MSVKIIGVEEVMNLRGNGRHRGVGGEFEMMLWSSHVWNSQKCLIKNEYWFLSQIMHILQA